MEREVVGTFLGALGQRLRVDRSKGGPAIRVHDSRRRPWNGSARRRRSRRSPALRSQSSRVPLGVSDPSTQRTDRGERLLDDLDPLGRRLVTARSGFGRDRAAAASQLQTGAAPCVGDRGAPAGSDLRVAQRIAEASRTVERDLGSSAAVQLRRLRLQRQARERPAVEGGRVGAEPMRKTRRRRVRPRVCWHRGGSPPAASFGLPRSMVAPKTVAALFERRTKTAARRPSLLPRRSTAGRRSRRPASRPRYRGARRQRRCAGGGADSPQPHAVERRVARRVGA